MIIHTIPVSLPSTMQRVVDELRDTKSQQECLKKAYDLLTEKYCGNRMKTLTHFFELFPSSVDEVWARNGFLHCTNQNWLLAILLIKSGHFAPEDMKTRWILLRIVSPHQYLRVKVGHKWINIDPWAKTYGIHFGDYAHGFHGGGKRLAQ